MSISITINNINTLSDAERAVLRLIAGNEASVADTLKATVRGMAAQPAPGEAAAEKICEALGFPTSQHYEDGDKVLLNGEVRTIGEQSAPAAPPAAPAPVATVPTPPAAPANPNLDAAGLPWDKRIHSSSKAKVADGTWRYARNLDKALIATVEAELRAVQAIPAPATAAPTPATSTNPPGWPFTEATTANTFATHGSPELDADPNAEHMPETGFAAPVAPAPIVPLPPAPTTLPMTFAQLMQHITPLLVSGKLTQPKLQGVVESLGIPHLAYLGGRPDLVETVKAAIDEVCK